MAKIRPRSRESESAVRGAERCEFSCDNRAAGVRHGHATAVNPWEHHVRVCPTCCACPPHSESHQVCPGYPLSLRPLPSLIRLLDTADNDVNAQLRRTYPRHHLATRALALPFLPTLLPLPRRTLMSRPASDSLTAAAVPAVLRWMSAVGDNPRRVGKERKGSRGRERGKDRGGGARSGAAQRTLQRRQRLVPIGKKRGGGGAP